LHRDVIVELDYEIVAENKKSLTFNKILKSLFR
jgi:hypothetical protein